MLSISKVLSEAIIGYANKASEKNRESRLLVPGLTHRIAIETHRSLLDHGIKSFLIVGGETKTSKSGQVLRPAGLTSERIGSFVAIANPGQLVHIQDSIRGTGGILRSQAFSEEWPWIDDGTAPFRFDGPILNRLITEWTSDSKEQEWLRDIVINGLLTQTRTYSERTHLLLESILGSFKPASYPELGDVRKEFAFHAGFPCPSHEIKPVKQLIDDSEKASKRIISRCQADEDIRVQCKDRVESLVYNEDRAKLLESVDYFLDNISETSTLNLGPIALYKGLIQEPPSVQHWERLHSDLLETIFDVVEREEAESSFKVVEHDGLLKTSGDELTTYQGDHLSLNVTYIIPPDQFNSSDWRLCVFSRQQLLSDTSLSKASSSELVEINTGQINSYKTSLSLRIALLEDGDERSTGRLKLHLCGENRPALVIADPLYDVSDAIESSNDEVSDKKLIVNTPVHLYMFSHHNVPVSLVDDDGSLIDIIQTDNPRIHRSAHRIDVSDSPIEQSNITCVFDSLEVRLTLETKDVERGEFTIQDELLFSIQNSRKAKSDELANIFSGAGDEPYLSLGKFNESARKRATYASIMNSRHGWKPLLTDLLNPTFNTTDSIGEYINFIGNVNGEVFRTLSLPVEAVKILTRYANIRDDILESVKKTIDLSGRRMEHPLYATHPIYQENNANDIDESIQKYLGAYNDILTYIRDYEHSLEWGQLLILIYLDCVVHWDGSPLSNTFILIGPWHPLVVAKRFMVQEELFKRASRKRSDVHSSLTVLLRQVQGFRWVLGLSGDERKTEGVYVSTTSDPGWHLGFTPTCETVAIREGLNGVSYISKAIHNNFGLKSETLPVTSHELATNAISDFIRSFPSRRSVGIRILHGYDAASIVQKITNSLLNNGEPTILGRKLSGGVRLHFRDEPGSDFEINHLNNPVKVYRYEDDDECIEIEHPEIYILSPVGNLTFRSTSKTFFLPRGMNEFSFAYDPVSWLTEGNQLIPKSINYEMDYADSSSGNGKSAYSRSLNLIHRAIPETLTTVCSVELPQRLKAPWVIIPGANIDPAILVKYVRDGVDRDLEERALWDYRVDFSNSSNAFYILSVVPEGFRVTVNGFFNSDNVANMFISELGRIGVAIGGEALKTGRRALGTIGLVGAVRILSDEAGNGKSALSNNAKSLAFLIPVDSFASFFGNQVKGKRSDLLFIRLNLPGEGASNLVISACGIEAKFVKGTFSLPKAHSALEQALASANDFKNLVASSLESGCIPERLALIKLVKFGLRITCPSDPGEIDDWTKKECLVKQLLLDGKYEYSANTHEGLLFSTEGGFPGSAEMLILSEGLWVRLTKNHWPGVAETEQLAGIRNALESKFGSPNILEDARSTKGGTEIEDSMDDEHQNTEPTVEPEGDDKEPPEIEPVSPDNIPNSSTEEESNLTFRKVPIGVDYNRAIINYDPKSLMDPLDNTNIMVTGSSGTGKTQLLKYLIYQLREQDRASLIIDFKNDFASDSHFCDLSKLDRVFVNFDGLPFNPLIPYPLLHPGTGELVLHCGQHITGIASVLKKTYGLGAQQQHAVKNAISAAFQSAGLPTTGTMPYTKGINYPDFRLVGEFLEEQNVSAYNRVDELFTLDIFQEEHRNASFHELIDRGLVLDLSQIQSDLIKDTLAQLIVMSSHTYYNSQPQTGDLKQFVIFDEAHRVLTSEYMLRLVRECRAYGVGTILSSQYPSDFPADISASMATKIIHGNGGDADRVRAIINMLGAESMEGDVANLDRFECLIDNRHHPIKVVRTMNYPGHLIYSALLARNNQSRNELENVSGYDSSKLPIGNIVNRLENMGLITEKDGMISVLNGDED